VIVVSETITVTGTGFESGTLTGTAPSICVNGVTCDDYTVFTDTEIQLICDQGIPQSY